MEWKDKPDGPGVYRVMIGSCPNPYWAWVETTGRFSFFGSSGSHTITEAMRLWYGPLPESPPPPEPLKPCPWCRGTDIQPANADRSEHSSFGFCKDCSAEGPLKKNGQTWQEAWNTRTEAK